MTRQTLRTIFFVAALFLWLAAPVCYFGGRYLYSSPSESELACQARADIANQQADDFERKSREANNQYLYNNKATLYEMHKAKSDTHSYADLAIMERSRGAAADAQAQELRFARFERVDFCARLAILALAVSAAPSLLFILTFFRVPTRRTVAG